MGSHSAAKLVVVRLLLSPAIQIASCAAGPNVVSYLRLRQFFHGGVMVSTGVWKPGKRAAVGPVCVKKDPLKRNDKTDNNFAFAA